MTEQHGNYYIGYEVMWATKTCPLCKEKPATAHGWLFKEPPPPPPELEKRKPVGEVFLHETGEDCVALAKSERPQKK